MTTRFLMVMLVLGCSRADAAAPNSVVDAVRKLRLSGVRHSAVGVTRKGTPIPCLVTQADVDPFQKKRRVLLVGGLDGTRASVQQVLKVIRWFYTSEDAVPLRSEVALSAIPCVNVDGVHLGMGKQNGSGGNPSVGYPPPHDAYNSPRDPEASYVWRWIGMHAPDLVIEVRHGKTNAFQLVKRELTGFLRGEPVGSLVRKLPSLRPAGVGSVPAGVAEVDRFDARFWQQQLAVAPRVSPARQELRRRLKRSPLTIAKTLSKHYGHDLKSVVYIPAVALIGRIRLARMTNDAAAMDDVKRIVEPYFSGAKPTSPRSGSGLSGHLVFCELAAITEGEERQRYLRLARNAADLGLDASGKPRTSMPFHVEMSDALFMGGPILARVGRLTGNDVYYQACVRHLRFMRKLVLREDGLYRHSPLDEAAWGRGNGFPALGLAMCLTAFPKERLNRDELLRAYRDHMDVLARRQDYTGCWHQVIDRDESYRELTSTCMITYAMLRGVREGWLDQNRYGPTIARAWRAIQCRIGSEGRLVDVCTGTGKQKDLRAYYDRKAILGKDPRGGAMALLVATEMAAWKDGNE